MEVCVVIPVHRPDPSEYELISFRQCYAILGAHPIKLVAPEGMDMDVYKKAVSVEIDIQYIDPVWLSSVGQYNKLKVSRFFYQLFDNFEYLLTYELDAFVFEDALLYWCSQGYDYIGAPWFKDFGNANSDNEFMGVGNSGFSLRKIKTIQKVLKEFYFKPVFNRKLTLGEKIKERLNYPYRKIKNLGQENYTIQKYFKSSEDLFFSFDVPLMYTDFKIAPVEKAFQFSFEVSPEVVFELNNNKMPFGCHAWWRYNLAFWYPHIQKYGHVL